ncbi:3,4-dihydroxyphenylacetate 2,3-dioxygenase [Bacillus massiliigorillae]|uniref:3,4-dihydroxyphenylacetate 2,3-dioxygenase n=1 Tax=Bacillus massiliigorillae TaxID=1243664 RepID=UPI00039A437D|nr:3,4-dihydroxyphenylacetate 2,3-dioxygenase [Bacillus massiliigorillae]
MTFSIIRIARTVLNVTDLDRSRAFYVDALGFIETERTDTHIYLRGLEEIHHHSLVLQKADKASVDVLGYKVTKEQDLEELEALFKSKGLPTKWMEEGTQHAIGRALHVQDISGLPIEFYCSMPQVERMLQRYDQYRGSRVQRIDHVNCAVPDVQKAYDFYVNELGFACSEDTVDKDGKLWASWLHRKPGVHDQAFMNGVGPRLHHVAFWLPDPLALIHTCDVLASVGYASSIERGPGRHGLSNAFFLYLRDPDGHRIELYNGDYLTSDPDVGPLHWDLDDPRRQTFWGAKAPDSWFDEASTLLDIITKEEVTTKEPTLEKRKPEFII